MDREKYQSLSLIVQLGGIALTLVVGAISRKLTFTAIFAGCVMFLANFLGQVLLAGEGGAACVGTIALPILGVRAAILGVALGKGLCWLHNRLQKHPKGSYPTDLDRPPV